MTRAKPQNLDRPKYADVQRDDMEDINELQSSQQPGDIRYRDPNRDRSLGEADRTGRHFDEITEPAADTENTENNEE